MATRCPSCQEKPSGIEGHPGLYVYTIGQKGVVFWCHACEWRWARWYAGEGKFNWTEIQPGEREGPGVPFGAFVPRR